MVLEPSAHQMLYTLGTLDLGHDTERTRWYGYHTAGSVRFVSQPNSGI